jgi:magnesium chelatase subunit ChlD-like protein
VLSVLECPGLLIDIERGPIRLGRAKQLAAALEADYRHIDELVSD